MRARAPGAWLAGAMLVAACGDSGEERAEPPPSDAEFIAFERDFKGFQGWRSVDLGTRTDASIHTSGARVAYVNAALPSGTLVAPKGGIIVKITGIGAETRRVFAMAKRGGTYNARGARGWEWFELDDSADAPRIVWRGVGPPDGESYAGGTECNTCHEAGEASDYVLGPELR